MWRPFAAAGLAALAVSLSSAPLQDLVANGETRTLSFAHIHIDEKLTVTYKRDGRYDPEALKRINWFMRDWRRDEPTAMDPHLLDILWEVHRETGAAGAITLVSAYRSPQTNSMLRARGRGVARYSQHTLGKAIDFFIPGADLAQMRAVGLRLQRGGIGFYPSSGSPFIHVDTGSVRHWPRMTRDQLARIFPDGKTVHLPADGQPMPGYQLALAEIEARGNRAGALALAAVDEDREEMLGTLPRPARAPIPTATVAESTPATARATRPQQAVVASLGLGPLPRPAVAAQTAVAALAAAPMPLPRPRDLGDVTASIRRDGAHALSYAAVPARELPGFGPIPGTHTRIMELPDRSRPPQSLRMTYGLAEAAQAPRFLLSAHAVAFAGELHEPDVYSLRGLVEPARAAIRSHFAHALIDAPSAARFAGPAVVALSVVAFDRGARIITGALAPRN